MVWLSRVPLWLLLGRRLLPSLGKGVRRMTRFVDRLAAMTLRQWCGWSLIVISSIAWTVLPLVPFLPMDAAQKVAVAGSVFIFAEVTWWLGVPLLGKEFIALSTQLWHWCKRQLGLAQNDGSSHAEGSEPEKDAATGAVKLEVKR